MTADELRKLLNFPDWMKEFMSSIPIIKIIVYDTLVTSELPKQLLQSRGSFEAIIPFPFRSRRLKAQGGPDMIFLRNLFRYDGHILNNPVLGEFTQDIDFQNAKKAVTQIGEILLNYISRTASSRVFEIEEQKKFSNSVKNFFSRNTTPERTTRVHNIPWKKIIYSQLASLQLIQGKYVEAQKNFKLFASQIDSLNLPGIKYSALYMAAILNTIIPGQINQLEPMIADILVNIASTNNLRFILYVPILTYELHAAMGNDALAQKLCRKTLDKIRQIWMGTSPSKLLITALVNERLAGFIREDQPDLDSDSNFITSIF